VNDAGGWTPKPAPRTSEGTTPLTHRTALGPMHRLYASHARVDAVDAQDNKETACFCLCPPTVAACHSQQPEAATHRQQWTAKRHPVPRCAAVSGNLRGQLPICVLAPSCSIPARSHMEWRIPHAQASLHHMPSSTSYVVQDRYPRAAVSARSPSPGRQPPMSMIKSMSAFPRCEVALSPACTRILPHWTSRVHVGMFPVFLNSR
jgi:hypothetical protein